LGTLFGCLLVEASRQLGHHKKAGLHCALQKRTV
jgi:hypothetical protein